MNLQRAITILYKEHEANVKVTSFWDSGFEIAVGDEANGYGTTLWCTVDELETCGDWIIGEGLDSYRKRKVGPLPYEMMEDHGLFTIYHNRPLGKGKVVMARGFNYDDAVFMLKALNAYEETEK